MERQTILERLGWRFIRIRGSEYYRNPDAAMKRVLEELTVFGIEPEESEAAGTETQSTELLQRVKTRAHAILAGEQDGGDIDIETISVALNPGADGIGGHAPVEEPKKLGMPQPVEEVKWEKVTADISAGAKEPATELPFVNNDSDVTPIPEEKSLPMQGEQMILPGMRNDTSGGVDILDFLNQAGVTYVDKRKKGGSLWLVGGKELSGVVSKARDLGYTFTFKSAGGQATRHKPGWWTK
jgi:hypothetical protein